jgi:Transglutaminase-like superfamily
VGEPGKVRSHLGKLHRLVRTPADAWLLARMVGWSLVLPVAKFLFPVRRLAGFMRLEPRAGGRDRAFEQSVVSLSAWVFKSRPRSSRDNCLERGLVTFRYLARAGAQPDLVVGVAKGAEGVHGHVWVLVDGRPVHDAVESLRRFEPLLTFKSDGTVIRTASA